MVNNEKGVLTLDFIFALMLGLGFTSLLLAINLSLSVIENIQYMSFASSRVYYAAHENPERQEELARQKFQELISQKGFGGLLKKEWFELEPSFGDLSAQYSDVEGQSELAFGVRVEVIAKILNIRLPLLGSTTDDEKGFKTAVQSFLGREPTSLECQGVQKNRWVGIQSLAPEYSQIEGSVYFSTEDNGC